VKGPSSASADPVENEISKSQAAGAVPAAPSAISAYSPHQLRRPAAGASEKLVTEAAALKREPPDSPAVPATADADDGFRPMILPLVREEPEPAREIHDISNIESKLDALSTTLSTLVNKMQISKDTTRGNYPAAVEELLLSLIENDVHEEFAHKLAREATEIIHRQNADARDVMEQLVRQTVGEASPLKLRRFQRTVVMLVGPTGVGKTTTLAKLAAIYQLNHHAKVGVITTDTFRIAAVQQLRTYAEILEVPLSVVYAPTDIAEALRDHEDKDVVLIDTAGKSPNDSTLEAEITELIRSSECDEVHLVLSATTGFTGLLNIINTYSFLRDYKVLFTKLDETPSWGMMLNTKFLTDKPISYIAAGQTVPDDIEVMAPRKIIDRLLGK
jgi:flagellar biosynthesis protein FlhF